MPTPRPPAGAPSAAATAESLPVRTAGTLRRGLAALIDLVPLGTLWLGATLWLAAAAPGPLGDSRWNLLDRFVDAVNQTPRVVIIPAGVLGVTLLLWHFLTVALSGTTPGKRVLGLRVIDARGRRPGVLRAFAHALLRVISLALWGAGHLWSIADPHRRTLYDRLSGTWVVEDLHVSPHGAASIADRPRARVQGEARRPQPLERHTT